MFVNASSCNCRIPFQVWTLWTFFSNSIWTAWAAKISGSGTDMPNTLNTARSVRVTPSSWEDVHLVDQEPAPLRSRILEILQVQLQLFTTTGTWYLPDWVPVTYLACWSHPGMTIIINVPIVAPRKPTTLATSLTSSDSVADSNLAAKRQNQIEQKDQKESNWEEWSKMIQRYQKNLKDLQLYCIKYKNSSNTNPQNKIIISNGHSSSERMHFPKLSALFQDTQMATRVSMVKQAMLRKYRK